MSRKRNSLSQSISSLAASVPDIPVVGAGDHTDHVGEPDEMIPVLERSYEQPDNHPNDGSRLINIFPPVSAPSSLDLFRAWSLTPEGHRVRDSRIPTDPVRLGCILDDNARIAFLAGYAAANPSFE